MVQERYFIDNRIINVADITYGGGIAYVASADSSRLTELSYENVRRVVKIAESPILPSAPTAVVTANLSDEQGVRARWYNSEWLRGEKFADYMQEDLGLDYNPRGVDFFERVQRIPFEFDYSHHGAEFDYFWIAPQAGSVELSFNTNDGVRVWIEGELKIERWLTQGPGVPGDPSRTTTVMVGKGQPLRIKIEFSNSKAVGGIVKMWFRYGASGDFEEVDKSAMRAVYRTGTRVDTEVILDITGDGVLQRFVGSEVSPDNGGCFGVGRDYLYAYPDGVAGPLQQFYIKGCSGACIIETRWHRILFPVRNQLELRHPGRPGDVEDSHEMPFVIHWLVQGPANMVYAIHRDGRFALLECTDKIIQIDQGRFDNAHNVIGGFFYAIPEVTPAFDQQQLLTQDEDQLQQGAVDLAQTVTVPETRVYQDEVYLAMQDYGIRKYKIDSATAIPTDLGKVVARTVQDVEAHHDGEVFTSTDDPSGDRKLNLFLPRRTASGVRAGFTVAPFRTGWLTTVRDEKYDVPGIQVPAIPDATVRFSFRNQEGETDIVDASGEWTAQSTMPVSRTQFVEFNPTQFWSAGDKIQILTLPAEAQTVPYAVYVEWGAQMDYPWRVDVIVVTPADEIFAIRGDNSPPGFNRDYKVEVGGAPVPPASILGDTSAPIAGGAVEGNADKGPGWYSQVVVNVRADYIDVWIDGTHIAQHPVMSPPLALPVDIMRYVDLSSPFIGSVSDVRFYADGLSDDQARIISGGPLTLEEDNT